MSRALLVIVARLLSHISARLRRGQARPSAFIHGFGAEPSDWAATADRLKARVAIAPHLPKVSWREKFETQGKQVESQLSSLATNSIAVGHSNGGVVAREWARLRQLGGIITIGTPHRGAPILANLPGWAAFTGTTKGLVNRAFSAFADDDGLDIDPRDCRKRAPRHVRLQPLVPDQPHQGARRHDDNSGHATDDAELVLPHVAQRQQQPGQGSLACAETRRDRERRLELLSRGPGAGHCAGTGR